MKVNFREYMHIERFGNDEVQGIELGLCYIFPKLDGTNASIWWNDGVQAGSRKRQLSLEEDNAGFYRYVLNDNRYYHLVSENRDLTFYGEWLVPHSLKTYRGEAWRNFWIFDVYSHITHKYIEYENYKSLLDDYAATYITPLSIIKNADYSNLLVELENNRFLIQDGKGNGEGIVIKNYLFQNKYNRTTWAKIVTIKDKHKKEMGADHKTFKKMIEQDICDEYVTKHLVDKVYAKIVNEMEGWNSKYIPRLLQTVYYDLINEEIWNIVKKKKNPTINFKTLNTLTILKIKEIKSELF